MKDILTVITELNPTLLKSIKCEGTAQWDNQLNIKCKWDIDPTKVLYIQIFRIDNLYNITTSIMYPGQFEFYAVKEVSKKEVAWFELDREILILNYKLKNRLN